MPILYLNNVPHYIRRNVDIPLPITGKFYCVEYEYFVDIFYDYNEQPISYIIPINELELKIYFYPMKFINGLYPIHVVDNDCIIYEDFIFYENNIINLPGKIDKIIYPYGEPEFIINKSIYRFNYKCIKKICDIPDEYDGGIHIDTERFIFYNKSRAVLYNKKRVYKLTMNIINNVIFIEYDNGYLHGGKSRYIVFIIGNKFMFRERLKNIDYSSINHVDVFADYVLIHKEKIYIFDDSCSTGEIYSVKEEYKVHPTVSTKSARN